MFSIYSILQCFLENSIFIPGVPSVQSFGSQLQICKDKTDGMKQNAWNCSETRKWGKNKQRKTVFGELRDVRAGLVLDVTGGEVL